MEFDRECYPTCARPASWRSCAVSFDRSSELRRLYFVHVWGMEIGPGLRDLVFGQTGQKLPARHPYRRRNGDQLWRRSFTTHDTLRGVHADTRIGKQCNIGANSIIMAEFGLATIAWSRRRAW